VQDIANICFGGISIHQNLFTFRDSVIFYFISFLIIALLQACKTCNGVVSVAY